MKKSLISRLSVVLMIAAGSHSFCQSSESSHFTLERIGDGIYAAIHKPGGQAVCNAGFVDLGGEVLVFDSFLSVAAARDLQKAIGDMTGKTARWLVNSHSHNDHIRGNQVFVPGASIVSSPAIRDYLAKHGKEEAEAEQSYAPGRMAFFQTSLQEADTEAEKAYAEMWLGYFEALVESYPDLVITLPDVVFNDSINFYGSKRSVTLIEYEHGHTDSDIILYLPGEKILFSGDLVFIGSHPYLADGDPAGLRKILAGLTEWPIDIVVPGHGAVGNKKDIQAMINYIDMVASMAEELKRLGKSPDDGNIDDIPEPYRAWQFPTFFQSNLKLMYDLAAGH